MKRYHLKYIFASLLLISALLISEATFAKVYIYPLSKDTTENNPQAFYCTATKIEPSYPGDTVYMSNFVQMVKGFQADGNLVIKADKLNQVHFLAYHDNTLDQFKNEPGYVALSAGTFDFQCYPGDGGRKLIDGPFGKARFTK